MQHRVIYFWGNHMHTVAGRRSHKSGRTGGKAAAVGAGVAAALLLTTAIPASALPGDPVVSYVDMGGYPATSAVLTSSALDGTGTKTSLASGINTQAYSVSDDGNTVAISGWAGAYSAPDSDITFGTVVTHRTGLNTQTQIVSSQYLANPVVSPDGAYVWFLNYIYSAGSSTPTLALYRFTVADHSMTRLALSSDFQPSTASGSEPVRLAVAPNGTNFAIVYQSHGANGGAINPSRILAAGATVGKGGNYFEYKQITGDSSALSSSSLAWADDSTTLTYSTFDTSTGDLTNSSVAVTSPNATPNGGSLASWYDISRYNNAWWMWKDDVSDPQSPFSSYGSSSDPSPLVAPTTLTTWQGSFDVRSFRLSATTPAIMTTPNNRPLAHADLILNASSVGYNKTTQYVSFNDYMVPISGQVFDYNYSETQQGVLESSPDGKTYKALRTTSGAHPVSAGGYTWTGVLPAVTRTLFYRWHFLGNTLASAGYSPVSKVVMIPTVSATIKKVGTKRTITGTATRVNGSVTLYKVVGSKATKVVTKPISAKGAYSFGTLSLASGTYRISTVADGYAGVGSKTFKI